eukprot:XP_001709595.1 Hypothetical protein GL50803_38154 [Giardia lamblia ATCC 50803]
MGNRRRRLKCKHPFKGIIRQDLWKKTTIIQMAITRLVARYAIAR